MNPEQISALVDGHAPDAGCDHLSPQEMALLHQFQLVGDLIRSSEPVISISSGFAASMAKRLAEEAVHAPQVASGSTIS